VPSSSTDIQELASGDDATCTQSSTSNFVSNQNYLALIQHNGGTHLATLAGLRFFIPSTIAAADITGAVVRLVLVGGSVGSTTHQVVGERSPAATWADTATDRPRERYAAAVTAGATQNTWVTGSISTGATVQTPDVAADIAVAVAANGSHSTTGTYVGVIIKASLNSPATSVQLGSYDNVTSSNRPVLRLTYNIPAVSVTVTPPPVAVTAKVKQATRGHYNISYHDGVGSSSYRQMDVYEPLIAEPPGGFQVVWWLHGGFWTEGVGTRFDLPPAFREFVTGLGCVLVNPSYKLSNGDFFTNTGPSFPDPTLDVKTAVNYLVSNASFYRVDTTTMVVTGESAGGQVALWTALSYGDTATYTGYDNVAGNRSDTPGNSRPAFDLDKNMSTTPFAGVFVWVAPVDIYEVTQHPDGTQAAANTLGRTLHMGEKIGTNPSSTYNELDLNDYITGTGTYAGTTREPTIPIGYVRGTSDSIVLSAAGVTALYDALGTSGFTYARPAVGTVSSTGLTRFEVASGHSDALDNPASWAQFESWLNAVLPDTVDVTVSPAAVGVVAARPAPAVGGGATVAGGVGAVASVRVVSVNGTESATVTPAPVGVVVARPVPGVAAVQNTTVTAAAVAVTVAPRVPAVSATETATVTPNPVAVNATEVAPGVTTGGSTSHAQPPVPVTVGLPAATVSTSGNVTVTVSPVAAVAAVPVPGTASSVTLAPSAQAVLASVRTVSVAAGGSVTVTVSPVAVSAATHVSVQQGSANVTAGVVAVGSVRAVTLVNDGNVVVTPNPLYVNAMCIDPGVVALSDGAETIYATPHRPPVVASPYR